MDGTEVLIPLAFFACIAAIIIVPNYFKNQARARMQDTIRTAIEKGQTLDQNTIDAVMRSGMMTTNRSQDWRRAVIALAVAAGFGAIGYAVGQHEGFNDSFHPFFAFAAIPGFIGLAYVVLGFLNKDKS